MHYKEIQTYDLYSFAKALEEAVKDGYQVLDETIYYPQVIGTTFLATVGKESSKETPKQTEEGILAETKPVRQRKTKDVETNV
jgi:hypothetical protein